MKKKDIKFKPLYELYDHGGDETLLKPKAICLSRISMENSTVNQKASGVELELFQERKIHNCRQLPSSEASTILCISCQSSYSEDIQSLEYSKGPGPSEGLPMLHDESSSQTTNAFGCQGDNSSCISKDDGATMISSDQFGGADNKYVTYSAPSVNSSCPDVLEKSLNGQTIRIGSPGDQLLVEDGDTSPMTAHKHSSEVILSTVGFSDGLGGLRSSETSFRNERDDLDHKSNEKSCILANTDTGLSVECPSVSVLKNLDGNECLKHSPMTSIQEPHLQRENTMCGSGSEELVDVRICDICGDVGREALLALCSKCSDGAEHIYCMSPKMDTLPEGDWLCEECMLTQDPKRLRQAMVEQSDSALKPSCLNEPSQGSPTINPAAQHVDKRRKNLLNEASCLSAKRLGSAIGVRSGIKKRSAARISVKPLKVYGSVVKIQSTHSSPLKSIAKGKDPARQVSSFVDLPAKKVVKQTCSSGDRSPEPEHKFCGGSSYNGKSVKSSNSNMEVRRSHLVYQRRSSTKENVCAELKKDHPDKKMLKSVSSTGGILSPVGVSNAHSSISSRKGLKSGSGKKYNEKCYSVAKKPNQQVLSVAGPSLMKVSSSRNKVGRKTFKAANSSKRNVEDKKGILINGNGNGKAHGTLVDEGKNCAKPIGVSVIVEERKSPCHSSYAINSSAEDINADCDQRVNLSTQDSEVDNLARVKNDQLVASYKTPPSDLTHAKSLPTLGRDNIDHEVPVAISAVPESNCVWKGIFKLEKSRELPADCYGVQAHLSTSASAKVAELIPKFSPEILLKEVPRSSTWPIQFLQNHPTEQAIAMYFFAQDLWSYGRNYKKLLESMTNNDLALVASFCGFQLLVFPSSLLPARSQCWNNIPFLWGVFRTRKVDGCSLSPPSLNIETSNKCMYSAVTCGAESRSGAASVTGNAFAHRMFHNSMQGSEYICPVVLQSPALVKSEDQSIEHEKPSLEKHIADLHYAQVNTVTFTHAWSKGDSGTSLQNDDLQKGNKYYDKDLESISNVNVIGVDHSTRAHTASTGFCSNGNYSSPGFTGFYDSASEPWQSHNVGSGVSFFLDSGPSGSSDGGGGAKSAAESQFELVNNDLNLNLCLGIGSESEATINLDLVLGIPSEGKHQPKRLKDGSYQGEDVSLGLSLGMPSHSTS